MADADHARWWTDDDTRRIAAVGQASDIRSHILRGAQLNSALYLVACFVAGLYTGHRAAWTLAIAAMGVTYLSYIYQLWTCGRPLDNQSLALVGASIGFGALAGIALLF